MIALPSYIDPMIWAAFVEQRAAMKVPFTQQAQKLVVMKLMKMHQDGYDANAALEKAAIYGYRSVFAEEQFKKPPAGAEAKDPALQKIEADSLKAAPMPANIKAKLESLKRQMTGAL